MGTCDHIIWFITWFIGSGCSHRQRLYTLHTHYISALTFPTLVNPQWYMIHTLHTYFGVLPYKPINQVSVPSNGNPILQEHRQQPWRHLRRARWGGASIEKRGEVDNTLCAVCCVLCTVCCVLCTACCVLCAVCCVRCTVYCVLRALWWVLWTVC